MPPQSDNTYTICNESNIADATHMTGGFDSLVNVSDFELSDPTLVPAAEDEAPKDEEVEQIEQDADASSVEEAFQYRNTVEFTVAESPRANTLRVENIAVDETAKSAGMYR